MTDHNTDRSIGVYCTDTSIGTVGIINEMLLYSNTGEIEFLPALPSKWRKGAINGLMARTNARVTRLEWDLDKGEVTASIESYKDQSIRIGCRAGKGCFKISKGTAHQNGEKIAFCKGEEIIITFPV
jgi:alpha-L-fucosidase 2